MKPYGRFLRTVSVVVFLTIVLVAALEPGPISAQTPAGSLQLTWVDRTGKVIGTVGTPGSYRGLDLSPDGRGVAVHRHDGNGGDVWVNDTNGELRRLTTDGPGTQDNSMPIWSPDGSRIAFGSLRNGKGGLYVKRADGSGSEELLWQSEILKVPMSWSPDGQYIIYWVSGGGQWVLPLTGNREPFQLVDAQTHGQISPDGKWIAYYQIEAGRPEVFIKPFPTGSGKWKVSTNGGVFPRWRGDGRELYFMTAFSSGQMMAAEIRANGTSLQSGAPFRLFDSSYENLSHPAYHTYDVSTDGQRFLIPIPSDGKVTSSHTGPAGTWRIDGLGGSFPWEVFLRVEGSKLTGMVNRCAPRPAAIYDGAVDGNTIMFKCRRETGDTLSFTGKLNGNEISFVWEYVGNGPRPVESNMMFGPLAPTAFKVKRVPDGDLAKAADLVEGVEWVASANLPSDDVKVEGRLFLTRKVEQIRYVIVVANWGNGPVFAEDPQVRKLLEATGAGLLRTWFTKMSGTSVDVPGPANAEIVTLLMQRLAQETGHQELGNAPLLFWGHSGGGSLGAVFAAAHPERTIALVAYHTGALRGSDVKIVGQIPSLILAGGKDTTVSAKELQDLWRSGRLAGAPWTFALDPDAAHADLASTTRANGVVIPWINAVLRQRLSTDGAALRAVSDGSSLLGNNQTGEVTPYANSPGSKAEASWLPDEDSARAWRTIIAVK